MSTARRFSRAPGAPPAATPDAAPAREERRAATPARDPEDPGDGDLDEELLPSEWRPVHAAGYLAIIALLTAILGLAAWLGYRRHPADAMGLWVLTALLAAPLAGAAAFEAWNDRLRSRRFLVERARRLAEAPPTPRRGVRRPSPTR